MTTPAPAPAGPETTAVAPAPKYLGTFKNPSHDVKGDIFMLDQNTLYIQGFSFDGQAPDPYFWSDGIPIPYYTRYDKALHELFSSLEHIIITREYGLVSLINNVNLYF